MWEKVPRRRRLKVPHPSQKSKLVFLIRAKMIPRRESMSPCTARMERLLTLSSWQEDILVCARQSNTLWSTTVSLVGGLCVHRRGLAPASSAPAWWSPGRSSWCLTTRLRSQRCFIRSLQETPDLNTKQPWITRKDFWIMMLILQRGLRLLMMKVTTSVSTPISG